MSWALTVLHDKTGSTKPNVSMIACCLYSSLAGYNAIGDFVLPHLTPYSIVLFLLPEIRMS